MKPGNGAGGGGEVYWAWTVAAAPRASTPATSLSVNPRFVCFLRVMR